MTLTESTEEGERLTAVLDALEKALGMERATLLLLSADGNELVYEAAHRGPQPDMPRIGYRRGEGVIGRVLETGRPEIIPKIDEEAEFRNRIHQRSPDETKDCAFLCVPVILGPDIIGALAVDMPRMSGRSLSLSAQSLRVVSSLISYDVHMRRKAELERQSLERENLRLRQQLGDVQNPANMVGMSDSMRAVYRRITQVAQSDTTVLIRGESGTGKELVASAIHYASLRANKPFVKVNCAALSENLLESELFGHEKGSFTGAMQTRIGRLEEAEGGTLFLDEIGEFSLNIQVKLLRVLQEKEFSRIGSNTLRKANVRFIVATNRDLEVAVANERFRHDLYYRINVFPVHLPPLRERREDILSLTNHFIETYAKKMNKPIHRISTTAIEMMMAYHWPGNVRELENCIEHSILLCNDDAIQGSHLPPTLMLPGAKDEAPSGSLRARVERLERDMLMDALKRSDGNVSATSRELGITTRMTRYKIEKLGIDLKSIFSRVDRGRSGK